MKKDITCYDWEKKIFAPTFKIFAPEEEENAGVPSLPTMLHTYLKIASKPTAVTDITHLEQLIPTTAVNNTWKTALGDGTTVAVVANTTSGSEAIAKGGQMETGKYLVDKSTTTLAGTTSTLITTKAMPYLQFVTDSSSTGAVETANIKIEFKAADAEGTWATVKGLAVWAHCYYYY